MDSRHLNWNILKVRNLVKNFVVNSSGLSSYNRSQNLSWGFSVNRLGPLDLEPDLLVGDLWVDGLLVVLSRAWNCNIFGNGFLLYISW